MAGLGGYSTRTEFFRDAAEGLLLELKYDPAPVRAGCRPTGWRPHRPPRPHHGGREPRRPPRRRRQTSGPDDRDTASPIADLGAHRTPRLVNEMVSQLWVKAVNRRRAPLRNAQPRLSVPLGGFPSRGKHAGWACSLRRLRRRSNGGGVGDYAGHPRSVGGHLGPRSSQPSFRPTGQTTIARPTAFKAFAIGSVPTRGDDVLRAEGPFFVARLPSRSKLQGGQLRDSD